MSFSKRLSFTFLIGVLAFFFGYAIAIYPLLPNRVAIHFNSKGDPDSFVPKDRYTLYIIIFQAGFPSLLAIVALCLKYLPNSLINIPHRKHWLAEERRESTLDVVGTFIIWIAFFSSCLFFAIIFISDQVSLGQIKSPALGFWLSIALYLLITLSMAIVFTLLFFNVPKNKTKPEQHETDPESENDLDAESH